MPCPSGMFRCSEGKCIPSLWVCNYQKDCEKGEDEFQSCRKYFTFFVSSSWVKACVCVCVCVGGWVSCMPSFLFCIVGWLICVVCAVLTNFLIKLSPSKRPTGRMAHYEWINFWLKIWLDSLTEFLDEKSRLAASTMLILRTNECHWMNQRETFSN